MPSKAKRKGSDYERKIAKLFSKAFNTNVRRTPGSGNLDISGDLRNLSGPLEAWVFELKKQEKINIWACIHQAQREAKYKKWALIFSRNREQDYVVLDINDFIELIQRGD